MIKLLIVDDNVGFCTRVREFLSSEPDIDIVGVAADGVDALLQARALRPDVVLMDVRMREVSGLDATEMLKSEMPNIKVIILSQFDLQAYRDAASAMGASAYVVKKICLTSFCQPYVR